MREKKNHLRERDALWIFRVDHDFMIQEIVNPFPFLDLGNVELAQLSSEICQVDLLADPGSGSFEEIANREFRRVDLDFKDTSEALLRWDYRKSMKRISIHRERWTLTHGQQWRNVFFRNPAGSIGIKLAPASLESPHLLSVQN